MDAGNHGTDEQVERYVLGQLSGSEIDQLETHLLMCEVCREKLDEAELFAPAIREALQYPRLTDEARSFWPAWLTGFRLATAGAFAALVLAIGIYWWGGTGKVAPMASLTLTAMRGDTSQAPAVKAALELNLNITDAPRGAGPFTVEIVDAGGSKVWSGAADASGADVHVKVGSRLSPGEYIARLYNAAGQLSHEYFFRVSA